MAAEKEAKSKPAPEPEKTADAAPAKKKSPKLVIIVAAAMVVEAVVVFLVVSMTAKKPAEAHATQIHGEAEADKEKPVEISLIEDEFQTMQGAQIWIWDTQIVLKVKQKNQKYVEDMLKERESEIRESIATMYRRAQPSQLREPGLETINRQVSVYLDKMLGKDADGKERVEKVLIPRCRGFSAN